MISYDSDGNIVEEIDCGNGKTYIPSSSNRGTYSVHSLQEKTSNKDFHSPSSERLRDSSTTERERSRSPIESTEGERSRSIGFDKDELNEMRPLLEKVLKKYSVDCDQFCKDVLEALGNCANAQSCSTDSITSAIIRAATLGISLRTDDQQAYFTTTRTKFGPILVLNTTYKGDIEIINRAAAASGGVAYYQDITMYDGDQLEVHCVNGKWNMDFSPKIPQSPNAQPTYYIQLIALDNVAGFSRIPASEMESIKQTILRAHKGYTKSPWETNPIQMAQKTALRRAMRGSVLSYATQKLTKEFRTLLNIQEQVEAEEIQEAKEVERMQ